MATEKQKQLINEFLNTLSGDEKNIYGEIMTYLLDLGYRPVKCKTSGFALDFHNSKLKQKIAKFYKDEFRLRFYANKKYSDKFSSGIKKVIEEFDGKYTSCYGCGRCKGGLRGYTYIYPNGKKVFRCGSELVEIASITMNDIAEMPSHGHFRAGVQGINRSLNPEKASGFSGRGAATKRANSFVHIRFARRSSGAQFAATSPWRGVGRSPMRTLSTC